MSDLPLFFDSRSGYGVLFKKKETLFLAKEAVVCFFVEKL